MIARRPAHTLPSFFRYLDKVFDFRQALEALSDDRQDPQIPPQAVFYGFVFRLRSFQQREGDLAEPHLQGWMHLQRGFRDDTLRYSLSSFHLEGLEEMWVNLNRQLKRHKAFQAGRGAPRGHLGRGRDPLQLSPLL